MKKPTAKFRAIIVIALIFTLMLFAREYWSLERTCGRIVAGMNKAAVSRLFERFPSSGEQELSRPFPAMQVVFQTNVNYGTVIWYDSAYPFVFEACWVYFDRNGIVVGYSYSSD